MSYYSQPRPANIFKCFLETGSHCVAQDHCTIIHWSNFNIVVPWVAGRTEEKEKDVGMAGQWSSQNTHNVYQLSLPSSKGMVRGALQRVPIVASKIANHRSS